jgi:hypothetical protein
MKTIKSMHRFGPFAALLVSTVTVHAAAYVGSSYEGFGYVAGNLTNTLDGGTGWNATGSLDPNTTTWGVGSNLTPGGTAANQTVTATGLSYSNTNYPASTGGAALIAGPGQIGRSFGQTVDSGTFYFSYLTQKTDLDVRTVNFSFFGANERLAIGQFASNVNTRAQDGTWLNGAGANDGSFALFVANSQNNTAVQTIQSAINGVYVNTTAPISYSLNTTFLVLGKFEFNYAGGVEDRFTLYINPTDLTNEANLTPYLQLSHNDFGSLTGFRMFAGGDVTNFPASAAMFDEIRFGSSFAQVIPEPGSAALLMLGAAGLLVRRRKRD